MALRWKQILHGLEISHQGCVTRPAQAGRFFFSYPMSGQGDSL